MQCNGFVKKNLPKDAYIWQKVISFMHCTSKLKFILGYVTCSKESSPWKHLKKKPKKLSRATVLYL